MSGQINPSNELATVQFFRKYPELFLKDLQRCYPLDEDHIEAFAEREDWDWDWVKISRNPNVLWTKELIESYSDYWDWSALSANSGLGWTIELVDYFVNLWDWQILSGNNDLPWSINFCNRFEDRINWRIVRLHEPWTIDFLEKYEDRFDWAQLSNFDLPWNVALISRFKDKWDWRSLSLNRSIPWSSEIINQFTDRWFWDSLEVVIPYELRLRYCGMNQHAPYSPPWTIDKMVREQRHERNWMSLEYEGLTLELIEENQDRWNWEVLSNNNAADDTDLWPKGIFDILQNRWDWSAVSLEFPHDAETIERHKEKWDWSRLSQNWALPWSVNLLEKYEDRWDFSKIVNHLTITKDTLTTPLVNRLLMELWDQFEGYDHLVLSQERTSSASSLPMINECFISDCFLPQPQSIQPVDVTVTIPNRITVHDQKFVFLGVRPYTKKDGTASQIIAWESQCTICGSAYEYTTPTLFDRSNFTRTCPLHRQPGRRHLKK